MLFLSQIIPVKGIERVLRGIHSIGSSKFSNWEFVIAGYENVSYKDFLIKTIDRLNLKSLVSFVGPIFGQNKIDLYDSASVFILPSFSEGRPISIIEALARGVPAITTKGTPWEELNTYNCGFWVENSEEGIKTGLITAHDSKVLQNMEHIVTRMDYISAGHYNKVDVLKDWLKKENLFIIIKMTLLSYNLQIRIYSFLSTSSVP